MAYFAQIDDDGTVLQVIAVSNDDAPDPAPENSEPLGQTFISLLGLEGVWRQTSYNANFRGKYAGIGDIYDPEQDIFYTPDEEPSAI